MPKIPRGGCRSRSLSEPSQENPFGLLVSAGPGRPRAQTAPGLGRRAALRRHLSLKPHPPDPPRGCLPFSFFSSHSMLLMALLPPRPVRPPLWGQFCPCPAPPPHPGPRKAARHVLPPSRAPALALSRPGASWPVHGSHCAFRENFATGLPGGDGQNLDKEGQACTRRTERAPGCHGWVPASRVR